MDEIIEYLIGIVNPTKFELIGSVLGVRCDLQRTKDHCLLISLPIYQDSDSRWNSKNTLPSPHSNSLRVLKVLLLILLCLVPAELGMHLWSGHLLIGEDEICNRSSMMLILVLIIKPLFIIE